MTFNLDEMLVGSPCSLPAMSVDEVLATYAQLGYRHFEVFVQWVQSRFDYYGDPAVYREKAERHGLRYHSLHLPPVNDAIEESVAEAVRATRFARDLGAQIVLFKANTRPLYIESARRFLDAIDGLGVTPVLQNHFGTAISTLEDFRAVIEGINDSRMKTLLEVGQFHSAGVDWRRAADFLGESIALVHIKDQIGPQSVPFGQGEIDLPGLFRYLDGAGYAGKVVVEMEVKDAENTVKYLADARRYLQDHLGAAA
ncbi:MAG TPA: sugar phosphate isomerase/epimerase family protein [Candidatus Sumerlaeota bacterium]|nr:sugar phosphate isomerase/epimerase family protein [Candidatus Sumerlaeota bacterium]